MLKPLLPVAALSLISAPAYAGVEVQSEGPVVQLSVTETVKAAPDITTIGAGVSTRAATAVEAMRANAREMTTIINRIKALGIAEDDIQTTGVSLNARYDYNRTTQKQVFQGYDASNRVSIILRDVTETGPTLDALVAAGATDINGPSFSIDDDTAARAQAREAAMTRALAMGRQYAGWNGYNDVRLLEISENVATSRPQPMMRAAVETQMSDVSTPIQPGLVGTSVTVSVTYEMMR
ncbi:MAG: SIMPL domain-containing protein [Parerythrobacter sp.]